jgi:ribokinase
VTASEVWAEPAGGGGVAAVRLARLAGEALFLTAVGDDEIGRRAARELRGLGVRVETVIRDEPQRRAFTYVDDDGERTITLLSRKLVPCAEDPLPWDELRDHDAVYFTGGDADAVRRARQARVLVATARELPTLREAGVELDVLVRSADDDNERYQHGDLVPVPKLDVATEGKEGGRFEGELGSGRFEATQLPGPLADTYGAGDSFAAGLTYALGRGDDVERALEFAAAQGAEAMTRRGAHGTR